MLVFIFSTTVAFAAEVEPAAVNADKFGIWTLIPPIVAIVLAFITKNVVISLFIGILSGSFLVSLAGHNVFGAFIQAFLDFVNRALNSLADPWNAGIVLQVLAIGGVAERGLQPQLLHPDDGRHAVPHVHLDGKRDRYLRADLLDFRPGGVGHARHVDEQVVASDADVAVAADSSSQLVESRPDAERRKDVRGDLEAEPPPDRPGQVGRLVVEVDLAAHDHMDQLVARGEPLRHQAAASVGYLLSGLVPRMLAPALSKKPKAARRPVSKRAWTAASECCGE